jgi:general stress protein YciG
MAQHQGNTGNFADDPKRAAEAGRTGGEHSHQGSTAQHKDEKAEKSASHNPGNFAEDREKAAEAGRKGGQSSHGHR